MMPLSANGVSSTRCSPKSFCSPSVTRKTPPSLPTSSPITSTFWSRSIAARRPSFNAFATVSVAMSRPLERRVVGEEGLALRRDQRRLLRVDLGEHPVRPRRGHVHAELPEPPCERVGLGRDLVEEPL